MCSCQITAQERAARWHELEKLLEPMRQEYAAATAEDVERAHAEAQRLQAEFISYGGLCPLILRLVVDGHGAYLRSRHDVFHVVVSPDSQDPWVSGDGEQIASGDERELWSQGHAWVDAAKAVRVTVGAVRRWQLRDCVHPHAASAFCAHCGAPLQSRYGA